jgi:hypothetical protein
MGLAVKTEKLKIENIGLMKGGMYINTGAKNETL